jgi:hypothetical protein
MEGTVKFGFIWLISYAVQLSTNELYDFDSRDGLTYPVQQRSRKQMYR